MTTEPRWTIREAVETLHPPIERHMLADLLAPFQHLARKRHGAAGRSPWAYPVRVIMDAHRDWVDRKYD